MRLEIKTYDMEGAWVDLDGIDCFHEGRQGLDIHIGNLNIHFEDEQDALRIAGAIVARLGSLAAEKPPAERCRVFGCQFDKGHYGCHSYHTGQEGPICSDCLADRKRWEL